MINTNKIQITSIENNTKRNKELTKHPKIPMCIQTKNGNYRFSNKENIISIIY